MKFFKKKFKVDSALTMAPSLFYFFRNLSFYRAGSVHRIQRTEKIENHMIQYDTIRPLDNYKDDNLFHSVTFSSVTTS